MSLLAVLLFMTQDLRAEARGADDFRADELRLRIFRETAGKALAEKLERWSPGLGASGAWEHDWAWTRLFLELPAEEFGGDPFFTGRDLEPLFAPALAGRTLDGDFHDVLWRASEWRIRGAIPRIVPLLRDPDPDVRDHVLMRLGELGAVEAVPDILPLLGDPDAEVRREALDTLTRLRAKAAVPAVRKLLADPGTRSAALGALPRLGDRDSLPAFESFLRDPDPDARRSAVAAIVRLGAWEKFPSIRPLLADRNPYVRTSAVEAATQLAGAEFAELVRPLLKDPSSRVRIAALDGWGDRERDRTAELIPLLRDPDEHVRNGALNRIGWARPKEAKDEIVRLFRSGRKDSEVVSLLGDLGAVETCAELVPLLKTKEGWVQEHVAEALGKLGGPEAVQALVRFYKDPDHKAREAAAKGLRRLKPLEAGPALLALLDDTEVHIRGGAAGLLGQLGVKGAVPKLLTMLNQDHEAVRVGIATALAELGEKEGIEELRRFFKAGRGDQRSNAAYSLHELGARESLPDFVEALTDSDEFVRFLAIEAVEEWGGKDAASKIEPLMGDKDTHYHAIHAVVRLYHRGAAPRLIELLDSPHENVRARAAWGLARLGGPEAVGPLRRRLEDPVPWVRDDVALALGALGDAGSVAALRKRLGEDDAARVRAAAAQALGDLAAREAVPDLVRALDDSDDDVWLAAAGALADLGAPELLPLMDKLEARESFAAGMSPCLGGRLSPGPLPPWSQGDFTLNARRRPMVWKKMEGKTFVRIPSDSLGEALERMAREAGLEIEWPKDVEADRARLWSSQWRESRGSTGGPGVEARPRSALLVALEQSVRDAEYEAVLEVDRIRLLRRDEASRFWRGWIHETRKQR
jgi:HEAT repeat protein